MLKRLLPYSGKCWREKTLANLAICYEFAKVLSANCSEKAIDIEAGLKFAKVFFAKYNLASNSPKFSPAKIFRYTVDIKLILFTNDGVAASVDDFYGQPTIMQCQQNFTHKFQPTISNNCSLKTTSQPFFTRY